MKYLILKRTAFIGKSMLWSACLYVVIMLAFNWDEVKSTMSGNTSITVLSANQQASVSEHIGLLKSVVIVIKSICGLSATIK